MQILYDPRDDPYHEKVGSRILYWLDDLGAIPLPEADPRQPGFLFAGARPIEDYHQLVADFPLVRDRPDERQLLLDLDSVLATLEAAGVQVLTPRTWLLPLDAPLPADLEFPLFVRTARSSWKKGGAISRVNSLEDLEAESAQLRRAFGWDATILTRQWLDLAAAGESPYGPLPQEVRTWSVDGVPIAWSFHYMNILAQPEGFPPSPDDLTTLQAMATQVASAFCSRLIAADFARAADGRWWLIEAGPGSCAGTGHEAVIKTVAMRLRGEISAIPGDRLGGLF